jgi:hypothetical protein
MCTGTLACFPREDLERLGIYAVVQKPVDTDNLLSAVACVEKEKPLRRVGSGPRALPLTPTM